MPQFGATLVILAWLSASYALIASLIGARRRHAALIASARNAAIVTWPLLTVASLLLIGLLVGGDYRVEYVYSVSERAMPTYLKITALWGGQKGSLLFWSWLMSTFAAAAMLRNWSRERALMPYVIAVTMGTLAFFTGVVAWWENPFARFWELPGGQVMIALFGPSRLLSVLTAAYVIPFSRVPGLLGVVLHGVIPLAPPLMARPAGALDGLGLNPLLRHVGMIAHPPMLYLGFVGFVVPYAFGMAALATGQLSDGWIRSTRRWTLVAWLFLSLGLILGARWAYDVLGWGGYWAWDPVENAALIPWLVGTAFLHSIIIQEKRDMLKRWNVVLIITTYLLVILGTFLTRSGVVGSVHSFARSAIGPLFFIFIALAAIISVRLLQLRWDALKATHQLDALISRESAFLLNNLLFLGIAFAVLWGTLFPMASELFTGEKVTVGPPYFNRTTAPMFAALVLLMGVAPLVAWKRASLRRMGRAMIWPGFAALALIVLLFVFGVRRAGALIGFGIAAFSAGITLLEFHQGALARVRSHGENYLRALMTLFGRNRRRYGGYLIHLGVIVMAVGIIGSSAFRQDTQQTVAAGETITLGDYIMRYDGLQRFLATDGRIVTRADVTVFKRGRPVGVLHPRRDLYPDGQPMTIPGNHSTPTEDFYVLLVTWEELSLSSATFKIYLNPLINWIWAGGLIFVVGTLVAAWPEVEERETVAHGLAVPAAGR